jgi:DNA-binding GntR family transcriptional regulator
MDTNPKKLLEVGATTAPQNISGQSAASFDVYRQLRDEIVNCKLKPGERLRFDALRATYGAGVGTLREALSHLVSDGLVRTEAGRGFRVAPMSITDLTDITNWRVEFESRAFTLSIDLGDDAWEAEIVTAFHLLNRTNGPKFTDAPEVWSDYGARHKRFHDALTSACASPWLLYFRGVLFEQARRYQALAVFRQEPLVYRGNEDHQELKDAALERDKKKAAEVIETHIRRTSSVVAEELNASGVID